MRAPIDLSGAMVVRGYGLSGSVPGGLAGQLMSLCAETVMSAPPFEYVRRHFCVDAGMMLKAEAVAASASATGRPTMDGTQGVRPETIARVMEPLLDGEEWLVRELVEATGLSQSRVNLTLRWLEDDGRVVMRGRVGSSRAQRWSRA